MPAGVLQLWRVNLGRLGPEQVLDALLQPARPLLGQLQGGFQLRDASPALLQLRLWGQPGLCARACTPAAPGQSAAAQNLGRRDAAAAA